MTTVDPELAPLVRVARVAQIWRRSRLAVFLYLVLFLPLGLGTHSVEDDQQTVEAGAVANWLGATVSVVSGGVGCILSTLVLAAMTPQLRAYCAPTADSSRSARP